MITYSNATSATATKNGSGEITFEGLSSMDDSIYFVNDISHSTLYLLSPPDIDVYSVQVQISYKYADEELNPRTVSKTIVFGVHIQVIEREVLLEAISPLVPTA